jgi:replication factor C subunit 1
MPPKKKKAETQANESAGPLTPVDGRGNFKRRLEAPEPGDEPKTVAKKKYNPFNPPVIPAVPNKHLRDQKIAENRGKGNCLAGLTFVITGVLDSKERDECAALIKEYGGKVTGGVSGKTSYLVAGIEPGESKVKQALVKKIKQIDEDGLLALIKKSGLVPRG